MSQSSDVSLVLEGGGYRGCFTAGILDVWMECNFYPFTNIWGTSAGALNACSYKAHQIGRQIRVCLAYRDDQRMMSLYSLVTTGSLVGSDFLLDEVQNTIDPFDSETFHQTKEQVWACATNVIFGTPSYFKIEDLPRDIPYLKASTALPLISEKIEIDNQYFVDGGTSDSVPVEMALGLDSAYNADLAIKQATQKAVVILTRPRDYRKKALNDVGLATYKKRYQKYPYFVDAAEHRPVMYNEQRERIFDLEKEGRTLVLAPFEDLSLKIAETSGDKLLKAYVQGRQVGISSLEAVKAFVSEPMSKANN